MFLSNRVTIYTCMAVCDWEKFVVTDIKPHGPHDLVHYFEKPNVNIRG